MLGPAHAISGTAAWLAGAAALQHLTDTEVSLSTVVVGGAVCAGSALMPDLDSPGSLSTKDGSTVVRAFGPLGEAIGHSLSAVSLAVYNGTRTRKDPVRTHGHRTFTHTVVFALLAGLLVSLAASQAREVTLLGQTLSIGQVIALVIMWAMLHLALIGLFEKRMKKARSRGGLLWLFVISGVVTAGTAVALPPSTGYPWLGAAVTVGVIAHIIGDGVTKMGVPALWPLPIRGRRWYDVAPPGPLRIRADSTAANAIAGTVLTVISVMSVVLIVAPGVLAA